MIRVIPMWNEMRKGTPARLPGYLEDVREAAVVPIILLLTADRADVLRFISLSDGFLLDGRRMSYRSGAERS